MLRRRLRIIDEDDETAYSSFQENALQPETTSDTPGNNELSSIAERLEDEMDTRRIAAYNDLVKRINKYNEKGAWNLLLMLQDSFDETLKTKATAFIGKKLKEDTAFKNYLDTLANSPFTHW
jgi:hypothetical protein